MAKKRNSDNVHLIDPDAPLNIKTSNGENYLQLPSDNEEVAERSSARTRRTPRDLGLAPSKANPIMVVLAYELYGFDDTSICEVTGLTQPQLNDIRAVDQFEIIKECLLESVSKASRDDVLAKLEQHSLKAVDVYIDALGSPRHQVAMSAADRVLGNLGYGKNDRGKSEKQQGLTIIINSKNDDDVSIRGM